MTTINLLPQWVAERKKSRRLIISLAILQLAVFLCIGAAIFLMQNWQQQAVERSATLHQNLAAHDETPALLAAELEQARLMARYFDEFILHHSPIQFQTVWVEAILQTLPYNAHLQNFNFSRTEIIVVGEIGDIANIELHRQGLLDSGLFEDVQIGRMSLLGSGMFSYALHIRVSADGE